jgi:ribosomal protein L34E
LIERKLYNCEIPGCNSKVAIRSTIKTGEHKGKKACPGCKHRIEGVSTPRKRLKSFNPKTKEKRKAERAGLPEFFEEAVKALTKNPRCANCGRKINAGYMPVMNIAHILSKSLYKSVMAHPKNFIPLCAYKDNPDGSSCHYDFDNNILDRPKMPCFKEAKERFDDFKDEVVERGKEYSVYIEN